MSKNPNMRSLVVASLALLVAGCGGSRATSASPEDAVKSYLGAIADDNGQKACDILTVQTRAAILSRSNTPDCARAFDQLHSVLGSDAARLKEAHLSTSSESGNTATVTASLDEHSVDVHVAKVDGDWKVATQRVAFHLFGIYGG